MPLIEKTAPEDPNLKGRKKMDEKQRPSGRNRMPRIWVLAAGSAQARVFGKSAGHLRKVAEFTPDAPGNCDGFARKLSLWLEESVKDDAFDRLVIVASAEMLDALRRCMEKPVYTRIIAETGRDDLPELGELALRQQLSEMLWF
ncbi:MAG: hypothetical protein GC185_04200 [Alphaproteobacteria bacterium]|nr:hypothetical protein [Alphaproteobacteria bacterium]